MMMLDVSSWSWYFFGVGSVFDFVLDFFDLILCDPLTLDVQGSHCSN